jgi:DNA/RNA endonuclease YhcR with UshA esterase domain
MINIKKRGVFMRRINVSLIMIYFLLTTGSICLAQEIIPWDQADKYYGKNVTVEGTIVSTSLGRKGKECFLNFNSDWQQGLTAIIYRNPEFPSKPEEFYNGKEVQITGVVQKLYGKPGIMVNDPSQIQIIQ